MPFANPEDYRAWRRQWRAKNSDHVRESRRRWYVNNQKYYLDYHRQWRAENPNYMREHGVGYRAFARAARANLRSLIQMGPRTSKLIRGYIDIESASDGEVTRFYRKLMKDLNDGDS